MSRRLPTIRDLAVPDETDDIRNYINGDMGNNEFLDSTIDILDKNTQNPLILSGGSFIDGTDYLLRKTNKNSQYCVVFTDDKTPCEKYYYDFLLKFNNFPNDQGFSKQHFDTIQNWFIVNNSFSVKGKFVDYLKEIDIYAEVLLIIGFGEGAKQLWKYLILNKLPIFLLDPIADNNSLNYYSSMSDTQRSMTILNSNSENWSSDKLTKKVLSTIENNYLNFDGSLIKQPGFKNLSATHNLIGQPLFNSNIIIKAYDSILNTNYYEENIKIFNLNFDRYTERYKL
jgi:hypothetical protein